MLPTRSFCTREKEREREVYRSRERRRGLDIASGERGKIGAFFFLRAIPPRERERFIYSRRDGEIAALFEPCARGRTAMRWIRARAPEKTSRILHLLAGAGAGGRIFMMCSSLFALLRR